MRFHFALADYDNRHLRAFARSGQESFERFRVNDRGAWLAILDVMDVIGGPRKGIYGNSNGPDFRGAEEGCDEFSRIRKHD